MLIHTKSRCILCPPSSHAVGQGGGQGKGLGCCHDEGSAVDLGGGQGGDQGTGLCGRHDEQRAVDQGSRDVHVGHLDGEDDAGSGHIG